MTFNTETLINAGKTFLMLFGELFGLFIGISFVVALLQVYVSQERIKRILTTPRKGLNSVLGALLGAVCNAALCSRRKKHFIFDSINTITAPSFR